MRRFAEDTQVPVSKSRGEIDALLRSWGATGVQWTDHWNEGRVALKFLWLASGKTYLARFTVQLPTDDELRAKSTYGGRAHGRILPGKFESLQQARGRQEHRLLALWLKAALNAVAAGIVPAEAIFLPFLEGKDGRTVYEVAGPTLDKLHQGSAALLLEGKR